MAAPHTLRWVALSLCALSLSAGCTRMLGIDGEYVQGQISSGGAGADDGAGGEATGDGGDVGTGGTDLGTGGTDSGLAPGAGGDVGAGGTTGDGGAIGAGGTITGEGGVPSAGNGGCGACPPPPRTACSEGLYTGSIRGKHSPSVTFVGVPLDVMGTLSFHVVPADAGDVARIEDGNITGTVGVAGSPPFVATLTGSVDCATGHLDGVIKGGFALTPNTAPILAFDGTHTGTFGSGRFSGTWEESEVVQVGNTRPYKGNGTWSADVSTP